MENLWEEANKTAQEKDQQIANLSQQLEELKNSNELASTKQTALASISNLGAVNAEQTLSLLQNKLQKNAEGKVVILNGGVEQDLNTYLTSLKNPGSGWEHHFKPSTAAGMGAKPTPTSNVGGGQVNPWKTGNLTQQMLLSEQNPQLAAVLKQEAQSYQSCWIRWIQHPSRWLGNCKLLNYSKWLLRFRITLGGVLLADIVKEII